MPDELADYYSRVVDYDDCMLNPRFWDLGTEAIDASTCAWDEENNWWVLPLHLIPRVIRHARSTKAKGTLVIPQWVSSPFWPLLFTNGIDPAGFIVAWTELPPIDELILPGLSGSNLFKGSPNTPVLGIRLDCSVSVKSRLADMLTWLHTQQ